MRIMPLLQAACLSHVMLSACVALLMMRPHQPADVGPAQAAGRLRSERGQPVRAAADQGQNDAAMLGPNYESTMQLLKTADEAAAGGPLFYVVSRLRPGAGRGQAGRHGLERSTPTSSPSWCKR